MKTTLLLIYLLFPWVLFSQPNQGLSNTFNISFEYTEISIDSTDSDRVLSPVADSYVFYDPYRDIMRVQSGVYAGPKHFGFESTYRIPESLQYVNLFIGIVNSSKSDAFWMGGLSVGREFRFNASERTRTESKTEYYFRTGTGLGVAGKGVINRRNSDLRVDSDLYIGLNSAALIGAQYHFNERTSLYIHGGGRMLWFPAVDEIGFSGVPLLSIGIQFSSAPQVPPVRF